MFMSKYAALLNFYSNAYILVMAQKNKNTK